MIVVTGAAGFIGSNLVKCLNEEGREDLVLVDDFSRDDKKPNWQNARFGELIQRNRFLGWLTENHSKVEFVFHLGARTNTVERNPALLNRLNTDYSKGLWLICSRYRIPLVYASSAAVYGNGEQGYSDEDSLTHQLKPLNEYGWSKLRFDQWVLKHGRNPVIASGVPMMDRDAMKQSPESTLNSPPFWAGLRFFNVYGPHEQHKGRMASVIFHAYRQIRETGKVKLFRSHRLDFADGGQKRDFIYVTDVINVCMHFLADHTHSGIYNVGTGNARSFNDLAHAVFKALGKEPAIEFIDTPEDIRANYQYFTEATIRKLRESGFLAEFMSLEEGVQDWVAVLADRT